MCSAERKPATIEVYRSSTRSTVMSACRATALLWMFASASMGHRLFW